MPSIKYIQPSIASNAVELDPAANGGPMRTALTIEAAINIVASAYIIFLPQHFLGSLVAKSSDITAAAITSTQHYGVAALVLTVPLVLAIPNTRRGIECRAPVYCLFGSFEICSVLLSLYQALGSGDRSGFSRNSLLNIAATFAGGLCWRTFVLYGHPEWLGRYRDNGKES